MLDMLLVILVLVSVIMMLLAYLHRDPVFALISSITWVVSGLGSLEIEVPYQMYNVSSQQIETGIQTIESLSGIGLLFMGFGVVMFVSFVILTLLTLTGEHPK